MTSAQGTLSGSINTWAEVWLGYLAQGLWDGALCLALAGLVWWGLGRRVGPAFGCWLFLLVLVKVAVPVGLPLALPQGWGSGTPATAPAAPAVMPGEVINTGVAGLGEAGSAEAPAPAVTVAVPGSWAVSEAPLAETPAGLTVAGWALVGWLGAVLGLAGATVYSHRRHRRWTVDGHPLEGGGWEALASRLGVSGRVRVVVSPSAVAPFVTGLLRPVVVVPEGLPERLSRDELEWVLLHELAHVRRGDLWVLGLQRLVRIAFFFNPAVWVASRMVDNLREFACDDLALANTGASRRACGAGFVSVLEAARGVGLPASAGVAALGMTGRQSLIKRRLRRILDEGQRPVTRYSAWGLIALLPLAAIASPRAADDGGTGGRESGGETSSAPGLSSGSLAPADDGGGGTGAGGLGGPGLDPGAGAGLPTGADAGGGRASRSYYVVQAGDTLTSIARDHGLGIEHLLTINPNLHPNTIRVGQVIVIRPRVSPGSGAGTAGLAPGGGVATPGTLKRAAAFRIRLAPDEGWTLFGLSEGERTGDGSVALQEALQLARVEKPDLPRVRISAPAEARASWIIAVVNQCRRLGFTGVDLHTGGSRDGVRPSSPPGLGALAGEEVFSDAFDGGTGLPDPSDGNTGLAGVGALAGGEEFSGAFEGGGFPGAVAGGTGLAGAGALAGGDADTGAGTEIGPGTTGKPLAPRRVRRSSRGLRLSVARPGIVAAVEVSRGKRVKAGDLLLRLDPSDAEAKLVTADNQLKVARAGLAVYQARLEQAKIKFKQVEIMAEKNLVSPEGVADGRAVVAAATAEMEKAQAELQVMISLRDHATLELERVNLRAPAAGRVTDLNVQPGEYATPGQPVVVLELDGEPGR